MAAKKYDPYEPHERIIFPLDGMDEERMRLMIKMIGRHVGVFKIGLEMFIRLGRRALDIVHENSEAEIMLDLKLHDIDKTVGRATAAAAELNPWLLTVHASGHEEMLKAAVKNRGPMLIAGVTVLTSLEEKDCREVYGDIPVAKVTQFARTLGKTGCQAIVCSPLELEALTEVTSDGVPDLVRIIPGIRPEWAVAAGQKRFTTPTMAMKNGADFLVIGDPINSAKDPVDACKRIAAEIAEAIA